MLRRPHHIPRVVVVRRHNPSSHKYPGTPKNGQWHLDCLENLTTLCKSCHGKEHERIDREKRERDAKSQKIFDAISNVISGAIGIAVLCGVGALLIFNFVNILKLLAFFGAILCWLVFSRNDHSS